MANIRSFSAFLIIFLVASSCSTKKADTAAIVDPCDSPEICDGIDNDCDGTIDIGASDAIAWYIDRDHDGYGTELHDAFGTSISPIWECPNPGGYKGYVDNDDDCDDTNADVNPGATEICNGVDDDCDGLVDSLDGTIEMNSMTVSYPDRDGDHFGDANSPGMTTCGIPTGNVTDYTDCDDYNADINPDAAEYCNGIDDDCDDVTDENNAVDALTWYCDADEDGYGDPTTGIPLCWSLPGYVADNTDCDDYNADINPGATETCDDKIDNDCNGTVDDCFHPA